MDENEFIAHIAEDGRTQTVEEHLRGTAKRAAKFAESFGAADAGSFAGLAHDIGKYSQAFQRRIRGEPIRCDHSTAGGIGVHEARSDVGRMLCAGASSGPFECGKPQ